MPSSAMISEQLIQVVEQGSLDEMHGLLQAGADPSYQDVLHGSTCLHSAAFRGDVTVIALLHAAGADPNLVTDHTSTSPLGTAALNGNYDAVIVLLEHRAKLSDHELKTSLLDECRSDGCDAIARLLESVR